MGGQILSDPIQVFASSEWASQSTGKLILEITHSCPGSPTYIAIRG